MTKGSKGVKIVLLEDEKDLANLYAKKLTAAGHEVKVFGEADALLNGLGKFKPDIAFLDHSLRSEHKCGLDTIPFLKKTNPDIKIAMLSNYSEFQMEQEARKRGAHDYLLKINNPPAALVVYVKNLFG